MKAVFETGDVITRWTGNCWKTYRTANDYYDFVSYKKGYVEGAKLHSEAVSFFNYFDDNAILAKYSAKVGRIQYVPIIISCFDGKTIETYYEGPEYATTLTSFISGETYKHVVNRFRGDVERGHEYTIRRLGL